jgi:IclR family transcriptional regulator, pca regulon regulatory protein
VPRPENPDFVEAIERGLAVILAFRVDRPAMSLSEVAAATALPRPTARRVLVTLQALGYVRCEDRRYRLTPRVLDLGYAYVASLGLWEVVRPHLRDLVAQTRESSSMSQLDGSEIVYVGRVAVPKIVTIAVSVGTRFPAVATSMGRVLLADLTPEQLQAALAAPPRGGVTPRVTPDPRDLKETLAQTRARGWALADQELAPGIRSVAAPVRDARGRTVAAINSCVQAAEYSIEELTGKFLPLLLDAASAISADLARSQWVTEVATGGGYAEPASASASAAGST